MTAWRDLAELVRAPAALSVPGDVVAGAAAAGALGPSDRRAGRVVRRACTGPAWPPTTGPTASWTPWSARSGRSRPAGSRPPPRWASPPASPPRASRLAGLAGGPRALAVAVPLAAAVWAYDLPLKDTAAGPAAMAACRGLDVLLGASHGRPRPAVAAVPRRAHRRRAHLYGDRAVPPRGAPAAAALLPAVTLAGTARRSRSPPPSSRPPRPSGRSGRWLARGLAGWYAAGYGRAQVRAVATPDAGHVQGRGRRRDHRPARAPGRVDRPVGAARCPPRSSPPRPARPGPGQEGVPDMSAPLRLRHQRLRQPPPRRRARRHRRPRLRGRRADPGPPAPRPVRPRPARAGRRAGGAGSTGSGSPSSSRPAPATCSTRGASTPRPCWTTTPRAAARLPAPGDPRRRRPGRRGGLLLGRDTPRRRCRPPPRGTGWYEGCDEVAAVADAAGRAAGLRTRTRHARARPSRTGSPAARQARRPRCFGLTLDIGHCRCLEPWPVRGMRAPRRARTWSTSRSTTCGRGVHEHLEFGEGEIDFPPVLAALADIGYGGLVAVELPRHSHARPEVARPSLAFLTRHARRRRRRADHPKPGHVTPRRSDDDRWTAADVLEGRVADPGWLADAVDRVAQDPDAVAVLFPAAGRRCGRGPLPRRRLPDGVDRGRRGPRPAADRAAAARPALAARSTTLYRHGDADEKRAVLRALPLLDLGAAGVPLILHDALRTNDTRLVAAALGPVRAPPRRRDLAAGRAQVRLHGRPAGRGGRPGRAGRRRTGPDARRTWPTSGTPPAAIDARRRRTSLLALHRRPAAPEPRGRRRPAGARRSRTTATPPRSSRCASSTRTST